MWPENLVDLYIVTVLKTEQESSLEIKYSSLNNSFARYRK